MTTDADAEADAKTVTEQPHAYRLPLTALVATEVSAAQDALDNAADPAWIRRHLHADVRLPQRIDIDRADAAPGDPKAIVALAVNIEADTPEHRAMMAKVSGPERATKERGSLWWDGDDTWQLVLTIPPPSFDLLWAAAGDKDKSIDLGVDIMLFEVDTVKLGGLRIGGKGFARHKHHHGVTFKYLSVVGQPAGAADPGRRDRFDRRAQELIVSQVDGLCHGHEVDARTKDHSQFKALLKANISAAVEYAANAGLTEEEFNDERGPLAEAYHIVYNLRDAVVGYAERSSDKPPNLDFWNFGRQPLMEVKRDKSAPRIDRDELERCAGRYLDLPFRCATVERVLVDMLTAAELYAYGEVVLVENPLARMLGAAPSPLHRRHPLLAWLGGQASNAVLFGVLGAGAWFAGNAGWIGGGWTVGIILTLIGLWCLLFVVGTLALPFFWYARGREKAKTVALLTAMQNAYIALQSAGPVSARHASARVEEAAALGVVWPAPLMAMLDDIAKRGGRF